MPGFVPPAASISAPAISAPVESAAGIPATSAAPIAEQASGLTTEGMLSTQNAFAGQGFENTGLLSKITDALGLSNMSGTTKVGLGMLGFNAYSQAQAKKQAYAFSQQMAALGAPLTAASNQLLQQYESGQLGPNDENTINKFIQDNKAQVKSFYAQSGLGDSSMAQRALESVDIQAASMKDQMRQNMLTSASTLAAQGNAPVMSGIQQQISSDQSLQKSQQDMMASLALLSSMGKKN